MTEQAWTAVAAIAGIIATIVTAALTNWANASSSKAERDATTKAAREAREEAKADAERTHLRNVADSMRRERREALTTLSDLIVPFVKGSSMEYQRLGDDEKKAWIDERVSTILTFAYRITDETLVREALEVCQHSGEVLTNTVSSARVLVARAGEMLNTLDERTDERRAQTDADL